MDNNFNSNFTPQPNPLNNQANNPLVNQQPIVSSPTQPIVSSPTQPIASSAPMGQPISSQPAGSADFFNQPEQPISSAQPTAQGSSAKFSGVHIAIIAIVGVVAAVAGFLIGRATVPANDGTNSSSGSSSTQSSSSSSNQSSSTNGSSSSTDSSSANNSGSSSSSSSSDGGTSVATLDGKVLSEEYSYDNTEYKNYIGKRITITNLLAYQYEDEWSLSPGLMTMITIKCSNVSQLGLVENGRYSVSGILASNSSAATYYMDSCQATQQQ